jgi:hypothetical protein
MAADGPEDVADGRGDDIVLHLLQLA